MSYADVQDAIASIERMLPFSTIWSGRSAVTAFLISVPATSTILTEDSPISKPIRCFPKMFCLFPFCTRCASFVLSQ